MATLLDYALCSVADVKELLGIDSGDNSKNNLIIRKINQATFMIENYTGRRFKETTYTNEVYDGGSNEIVLRNWPVTSTQAFSLGYRESILNEADWDTVETEEYYVDNASGVIRGVGYFFGPTDKYRVTYSAGYATIPADIAEACASLAAYLTDNANTASSTNVKSKSEGSRTITYSDAPKDKSLLSQLGLDDILDAYTTPTVSGLL